MAGAPGAGLNPPANPDVRRQQMMGSVIMGGGRSPMGGGMRAPSPAPSPDGGGDNQSKQMISAAMEEIADKIASVIPIVETSAPALMPLLHMMVKVGMQISKQLDQGGGGAPASGSEAEPVGGGRGPE